MLDIFAGTFTFAARLWSKDVENEVPLPANLAFMGVAQAIRVEQGATSAQPVTYNEAGERVTWGFTYTYSEGGGGSFHEFTPVDAERVWNRMSAGIDERDVTVTRWEGGKVTARLVHRTEGK